MVENDLTVRLEMKYENARKHGFKNKHDTKTGHTEFFRTAAPEMNCENRTA